MSKSPQDSLDKDLAYLSQVLRVRLQQHFALEGAFSDWTEIPLPDKRDLRSSFSSFLKKLDLLPEEYVLILIALAPHVRPDFFDRILSETLPQAGEFPQIGGIRGRQHRGFLPTGETALFILAGEDLEKRFQVQRLFDEDHFFARKQILSLTAAKAGEPTMSGLLTLDQEYIELFTRGRISRPKFGIQFPARRIETQMDWEDLVINKQTRSQIQELEAWVQHGQTLLKDWGLGKKLGVGYRALFYGPSGTGKTLTASLLGKSTGRDIYKIDLSLVVSKYIGETEKNLANLFAKAENKDWILFFDEADALFGKRTSVKDAHDRYANQEVSYLLQRVETYDGLVILASNFKSNIDEAFLRRFQSIIHFPMPKVQERLRLWEAAFPDPEIFQLDPDIDLRNIAQKYELTGANIMNIVQHACLQALAKGKNIISLSELEDAIKREFSKEGKVL